MKTVIVGGVAGGASAAARLRRLDEGMDIIMLERGEHISYANCGLPYYVGGEIADKKALTLQTPASFSSRYRVDVRVESEVMSIDRDNRRVQVKNLKTGEEYFESYDRLILSPGAEPIAPPIKGEGPVFTLRTVGDAVNIREYIKLKAPKTALVVGGGYIGMEMAENLVKAGLEVTIAEMGENLLARFDFDMAAPVHAHVRDKGVKILLSATVSELLAHDGGVLARIGGRELKFDMVLWSVGVRPETGLAREAGLTLNLRGAIVTDEHMCTNDPFIYAVGDAVEVKNFVTKAPAHIPLAGPANRQGRIAADNIAGIKSRYKGTQGSSILRVFDLAAASTGITEREARQSGLNYDKVYLTSPSHATYYPGFSYMSIKVIFDKGSGKILGAQIVGGDGVDKRCDVLAVAIRASMTAADLCTLELCYAPPFSSAKDPVNMAGFAIENIIEGRVRQFHWHDADELARAGETLLDVRTEAEFARGHIAGAVNIPLDSLRERLSEIDRSRTVYVNCRSGFRSYMACRTLMAYGVECYNLAGGYLLYEAVTKELKRLGE